MNPLVAYIDPFAGVSGDMCLGSLLDAGWPLQRLHEVITRLGLPNVHIEAQRVHKRGISATHLRIIAPHEHAHRHRSDLVAMVTRAGFPSATEARAVAVIDLLAQAEGRVHGVSIDEVHFHEVGAVDTIVDIVGTVVGLSDLGVEELTCGPLPWSGGTVKTEHGILPVPPPAVAALLEGLPVIGVPVQGEMVTPTGAALMRGLAASFGPLPAMQVRRVGYGAGTREWPDRPNLLRVVLGEAQRGLHPLQDETLTLIACNLDDMNPQWYGPLMDALFEAGALDVWLTPIQMKKNRPATLIEALCPPHAAETLRAALFRHSTTLGLRSQRVTRHSLDRRFETVETRYGPVRVKVGLLPDGSRRPAPEHEDCARLAAEHGVTPREVWLAALELAGG